MQFDNSQQVADLAALPPEPPKPPERSLWGVAARSVVGGVAQMAGQVQQLSAGIDERYAAESDQLRGAGSRQAVSARQSAEGLGARGAALTDFERGLRPDPATATTAENLVYGLGRGLTKAIGSVATMGPVAGAAAFGASEGGATYDDLTREGVDPATAGKAALAVGLANAAGVALPAFGSTLMRTAGLYVAGGPGGFMAQQQATRSILEAADYREQAMKFDPLDPMGLALSALIPLPFAGYGALRNIRAGKKMAPALPDQAPRGDQARAKAEVAPAAAEAPAARVSQEHIDAALTHNLTLVRQATESTPPAAAVAEMFRGPVTENPNFKAWFGASKVVREDGAPMVMYRGTANSDAGAYPGGLVYLTGDKGFASLYASNKEGGAVFPLYVKAESVFDASRGDGYALWKQFVNETSAASWAAAGTGRGALPTWQQEPALRQWLSAKGVNPDAIWFAESNGSASLAVKDVSQLKSAIGNSGRFDPNSGSLTDAEPPAKAAEAMPPKTPSTTPQIDAARSALAEVNAGKTADEVAAALAPDVRNLLVGMFEAGKDSARAERMLADYARTVAQQRHRPTVDVAADVVEASRTGKTVTPEPEAPVAVKPEEAAAASAGNRLAEIQQQNPDMVVRITEDGKPVTVAEELAALKREVAEGTDTELGALDADLVRVAAECALATATA